MPFETRADKRHPVEATAQFSVHESMVGSVKLNIPASGIKAGLVDISGTGCALDSPYLIPPDTLLKIDINSSLFTEELKIEHPQPIAVTGSVRSCIMKSVGHYRLGIRFAEIKKEDVELVNNFIKSKERRDSPRWDMSK